MVAEVLRLLLLQVLFGGYRLISLPGLTGFWFLLPMGEALIMGALAGMLRKRVFTLALAVPVSVLLLHNGGELFYRIFYLQHFNPFSDLALVPGLLRMLFPDLPVSDSVLAILSLAGTVMLLLAISIVIVLLLFLIRTKYQVVRLKTLRLATIVVGVGFIVVFPLQSPMVQMVLAAKDALTVSVKTPEVPLADSAPVVDVKVTESWSFPGIQDADIHLIVVESYGATLLYRPEYLEVMRPLYTELDAALDKAGYVVFSGTVASPAFGGRSWLADGTLLTGVFIPDQLTYDSIAKGGQPARLLELVEKAGYHRVYAAPGTRNAPDDWRQVYAFDTYLLRYDFEYTGPFIALGAMPDQYLLDYTAGKILQPERKEFAVYLLVSSHVPFEVIPIYQNAWEFPLGGKEFETGMLRNFDNDWLSGNELAEGYLAGMEYSLRSSVGYFTDKLDGLNIGLIVGDHQPRKPVSHSTADYQVPFHLVLPRSLYTDTTILRLSDWKLKAGMEPDTDPDAKGMDSLPDMLELLFLNTD